MAVNDSEKKSRAILEKQTKKGEEYQGFQEAQGQLLNIQAEQRANLNEQRAISGMEVQQNQTLAQAAEIMAASGGGAGGAMMAVPQQNPKGTQAILNKFGIGKPGTQRATKTQQVNNTPQKINITNNTTTHNNIQVSQPQIPMQQPVIPMRTPSGSDTNKFKVWLSNAFARQNEAAAIRDKEYQKREWALTRSANRMIRKMGDLGKAFADKMNPKNISNMFGDQLKVVMFLMGFAIVADNIDNIMKFAGGIKEKVVGLYQWFTNIKKGDNTNSFRGLLVNLLGGKEGESALQAGKGLLSQIGDAVSIKLQNFLEKRGNAVRAIPKPDIDITRDGLGGLFSKLVGYLGDVIATSVSGTRGLERAIFRQTRERAHSSNLEEWNGIQAQRSNIRKDTDTGDYVLFDKNKKKSHKMVSTDFGLNGRLLSNSGGSVKYSNYFHNLATETGSGTLKTEEMGEALLKLYETSKSHHDGIMVTDEFLTSLGELTQSQEAIRNLKQTKLKKKRGRLISVPMSELEYMRQGAHAIHSKTADDMAWGTGVGTAAGLTAGMFLPGGPLIWAPLLATGGYQVGKGVGLVRRAGEADNIFKLVAEDDPNYPIEKYPTVKDRNGKPLIDDYYSIASEDFDYIAKSSYLGEGKFDFNSINTKEGWELLEKMAYLQRQENNKVSGNSNYIPVGRSKIEKDLSTLNELKKEESKLDQIEEVQLSKLDRLNKSQAAVKEIKSTYVDPAVNYIENAISSIKESLSDSDNAISTTPSKIVRLSIDKLNKEVREGNDYSKQYKSQEDVDRSNYILARLVNEAGLSVTQAAGLVGNFWQESKFRPGIENPDSGATGLAQWLWHTRRDNFKRIIGKDPSKANLKEQVDFVVWELNNGNTGVEKGGAGLKTKQKLSKVVDGNILDATKVGFMSYEGSDRYDLADYEKEKAEFEGSGGGKVRLDIRYSAARDTINNIPQNGTIDVTSLERKLKLIPENSAIATEGGDLKLTQKSLETGNAVATEGKDLKLKPPVKKRVSRKKVYDSLTDEEKLSLLIREQMGEHYNPYQDEFSSSAEKIGKKYSWLERLVGYSDEFQTAFNLSDLNLSNIGKISSVDEFMKSFEDNYKGLEQLGYGTKRQYNAKKRIIEAINKAKKAGNDNYWEYLSDDDKKFVLSNELVNKKTDVFHNTSFYNFKPEMDSLLSNMSNAVNFEYKATSLDRKVNKYEKILQSNYDRDVSLWNENQSKIAKRRLIFGEDMVDDNGDVIWNENIINSILNYARRTWGKSKVWKKLNEKGWQVQNVEHFVGARKYLRGLKDKSIIRELINEYEQDLSGVGSNQLDTNLRYATTKGFRDQAMKDFKLDGKSSEDIQKSIESSSDDLFKTYKEYLGLESQDISRSDLARLLTVGKDSNKYLNGDNERFKKYSDNYKNSIKNITTTLNEKLKANDGGQIGNYKITYINSKGLVTDVANALGNNDITIENYQAVQTQLTAAVVEKIADLNNSVEQLKLINFGVLDTNQRQLVIESIVAGNTSGGNTPNMPQVDS